MQSTGSEVEEIRGLYSQMQIDSQQKNGVGGNGGVKRGKKMGISFVLTYMALASRRL